MNKLLRILLFAVFIIAASQPVAASNMDFESMREEMVRTQIKARGIDDPEVISAIKKVPRHKFVPAGVKEDAYEDHPLPIGYGQTISQPYIVAYMTDAADIKPDDKVLEIGTGSGYQAAILSLIAEEVYSIEIVKELAYRASKTLDQLGYKNVHVRHGDGYKGWPEKAPFDAIIVTAAPPKIPDALLEQLKVGGTMIVPVGEGRQQLYKIKRSEAGFVKDKILPVRFVPMVHEDGS